MDGGGGTEKILWYGFAVMNESQSKSKNTCDGAGTSNSGGRTLTEAAKRALAEAAERRKLEEENSSKNQEVGGREGPDPVRYGDWEKNGIISDF